MAGDLAVPESVTLAGRRDRVRIARAFAAGLLGPAHPCAETTALLISEIVANSVRHSRSGDPGETITVTITATTTAVRAEVTDCGGRGVPELRRVGRDAEGGRGLHLVDGMAARWGYWQRNGRTTTWFEVGEVQERVP